MTWRKTWFSYLLWGLNSILVCTAFGFLMCDFVKVYHLSALFIVLPIAVVLLCYFLVKKCKKYVGPLLISHNYWITMEGLFFVLLFAGGFLARLYSVTDISGSEMFQMCSVSAQSSEIVQYTQPVLELFVAFYKNAFYYVGNSWIVAVAVQLNLQLISFVVLYFVVRKTIGVIGALVTFAFVLFSPMCITASVTLDPAVLYFALCVLAMYFITEAVCRITRRGQIRWYQYVAVCFIGLYTGCVVYLDILGLFVMVYAFTLLLLQKYKADKAKVRLLPVYYVLYVLGVLFGIAGMLLLSCRFQIAELKERFLQWENVFMPTLGESLYSGIRITFGLREWIYCAVILFALLIGILGFFESKIHHPQFGATLCLPIIFALRYACPAANVVEGKPFLVVFLAVFAGASIQALLLKDARICENPEGILEELTEDIVSETEEEIIEEAVVEPAAETEEKKEATEPATEVVEEINYIPNPLPLPKKHVKKTMNFGLDVEDDKMDFDIEVSDDDDFDI